MMGGVDFSNICKKGSSLGAIGQDTDITTISRADIGHYGSVIQKKIGVGAWQFMVNVETPNSHVFDQDECLLKVTVRLCNNKGKHSRKEFDLPEINRRKYRHVCGVNTIMGELMRIDRSSKESSWKYEGVEKAIFDAIDQYEKWCDENLYAGTD